jgi:glutamyl/glutaminyl-tRNA synthetase
VRVACGWIGGVSAGRTRIAPTPSGYLHRGNLVHVLIVDAVAHTLDLDVHLRIDAFDSPRVRPEYVRDIFRALDMFDVAWSSGPRSPDDASTAWQSIDWPSEVASASARGLVTYACRCTRRDRAAVKVCSCSDNGDAFVSGQSALRLDALRSGLDQRLHGTLMWRRDGLPSTHLASVLNDRDNEITHVIRGADLADASHVQCAIAPFFGADSLAHATFMHHEVLVADDGSKLSKSSGSSARPLDITPRVANELRELASEVAKRLIP